MFSGASFAVSQRGSNLGWEGHLSRVIRCNGDEGVKFIEVVCDSLLRLINSTMGRFYRRVLGHIF